MRTRTPKETGTATAMTTRRFLAAAVLIALSGLLVGCGGGNGSNDMSSGGDAPASSGAGGSVMDEGAPALAPGATRSKAHGAPGANRTAVQTRAVIKTGQVAVTAKDLDQVRQDVDNLVLAFGGALDREETSHDRHGNIERATLVLRVPVANFTAAMDSLQKLGTMKTSNSTSKDVTTEVIDVDERVQTLQNSLDRLQRFQRRAQNINDLLRFEDQITNRESELQSLKAQQAYLSDQTSMSTITLSLSTPQTYVAPPGALDDAGFLAGLKGGWNALKDFVVVAMTVVGAILPFAVGLGLVGLPLWFLLSAILRRRAETDVAASVKAPSET